MHASFRRQTIHHVAAFFLQQKAYPMFPDYELKNLLIYVLGDVKKARERIEISLAWRRQHMPINREAILKPLHQGLFYFHGFDRAGK